MTISTFKRSSEIKTSVDKLRDWHFAEGAFEKLTPPWEKAKLIQSPSELTDGCIAVIEVGIGPLKQKWVAEHEITDDGFIDRQKEGPFVFWEHHHQFLPLGDSCCQLIDSISYRLPFGKFGHLFGDPLVRRKLDRMFRYRHETTRKALEN